MEMHDEVSKHFQDIGFHQYEKKIYDQDQLLNISKALNSDLNIDSLIGTILDNCLAQAQTAMAGIFLQPGVEHSDFILQSNAIGFDVPEGSELRINSKHPVIDYLARNPRNYRPRTAEISELFEEMSGDETDIEFLNRLNEMSRNMLLIPMYAKGKVNGIIILGGKNGGEGYEASEKDFLLNLASIAAIAVENAKLYELATVDMMTRLKIHHFFQTRLREEIETAREEDRPLSLLLTDIDHFKKFNDTYGHQLGDLVLIAVAGVLIKKASPRDVPSRYGGEEFALILPGTDLNRAENIAEDIRRAVEKLEVDNPTDAGDKKLKVTISIGVAQFNKEIDSENKDLIGRCDKALYAAKHAGRNRVELSQV